MLTIINEIKDTFDVIYKLIISNKYFIEKEPSYKRISFGDIDFSYDLDTLGSNIGYISESKITFERDNDIDLILSTDKVISINSIELTDEWYFQNSLIYKKEVLYNMILFKFINDFTDFKYFNISRYNFINIIQEYNKQ